MRILILFIFLLVGLSCNSPNNASDDPIVVMELVKETFPEMDETTQIQIVDLIISKFQLINDLKPEK